MPSIATQTKRLQDAIDAGALRPTIAEPEKPPIPVADYPVSINAYSRGPLPASSVQQPDMQRGWQTGATPQVRLIPIGPISSPVIGAVAQSQAIQQIAATPATTAPSGGVTSVGLTMPGIFTAPVSGSPVTLAGTLAVTLANEPFNTVFAGPSSTQGSLALDTTATSAGNSSPAIISGGTTQLNDFALLLVEIDSSTSALTATPPAGWTQINGIGTGGGNGGGLFWQSISSAGGFSASASYSFSAGAPKWGASLVTVKTSGGTPSIRQNQSAVISGAAGPNGSDTLAFAGNTLAGSTIFLVIQGLIGLVAPITFQITDSQGNVYTLINSQTFPGQTTNQFCQQLIYAAPSSSAAACTITIKNPTTANGGPGLVFYSLEVPNLTLPVLTPIFRKLGVSDLPGFSNAGLLQPSAGGTGTNLSATGGSSQFLRQNSVGAAITVVQPDYSDLAGIAIPTTYNNVTVGNNRGFPVERGTPIDLTAQAAAIGATTLYAVPALSQAAGMYRVSWVAKVTTPATSSSTLGGTNGFQCVYTDQDDSVVVTTPVWWGGGNNGAAPTEASLNTTQTQVSGELILNVKLNTTIQYKFDYTSSGVTAMQYNLHVKIEAL